MQHSADFDPDLNSLSGPGKVVCVLDPNLAIDDKSDADCNPNNNGCTNLKAYHEYPAWGGSPRPDERSEDSDIYNMRCEQASEHSPLCIPAGCDFAVSHASG
jgi:hypothetical protein